MINVRNDEGFMSKDDKSKMRLLNDSMEAISDGRVEQLRQFYNEHGQWARHYSTVRMTVGTFFLGVALVTVQFRWEQMDIFALLGVILAVGFGLGVFYFFSKQTLLSLNSQLKVANSLMELYGVDRDDRINVPDARRQIRLQVGTMGVVPAVVVIGLATALFINQLQT